jgi:hypothetical protein
VSRTKLRGISQRLLPARAVLKAMLVVVLATGALVVAPVVTSTLGAREVDGVLGEEAGHEQAGHRRAGHGPTVSR